MDKSSVDSDTAERLTLGTDELTVLATSAETGGAPFAVMVRMPPGGGPPVLHRHDPGEVYYVVDGQFTFYTGGPDTPAERFTAGPGTGCCSRRWNSSHGSQRVGRRRVRVVHAPGAPMENFSRAAATLPADQPPSMEAVLAIAQRQGIELLGPIPVSQSRTTNGAHFSAKS
jgi:hypothetical protein